MKILVTGAAGFIGFHLSKKLIADGHEVVGLDNLNHYYDVRLKLDRLAELGIDAMEIAMGKAEMRSKDNSFRFVKTDLAEESKIMRLFAAENFEVVFNLAAQAGVRYSLEQPQTYVRSNLVGFANILEACRRYPVRHLIFASSSSVYGSNQSVPFKVTDNVDRPISLYAASKKSNELMAHSYSHLFQIPTTGLRFFTVYGEWGRPDMATMLFADAIAKGKPIKVFNHGEMSRDFTYVGDVVEGLLKVMQKPLVGEAENPPYRLYNIGSHAPVKLGKFIETIERKMGKEAEKIMLPLQQGDMKDTYADVTELMNDFAYRPKTSLEEGIEKFVKWYKEYYFDVV